MGEFGTLIISEYEVVGCFPEYWWVSENNIQQVAIPTISSKILQKQIQWSKIANSPLEYIFDSFIDV